MAVFKYPADLAERIEANWPADLPKDPLAQHRPGLLDLAYQASLAREEERPVRIRLLLARREDLPADGSGLGPLVLQFDRSRPCELDELRRISPSAPFETALVCVGPTESSELRLWGIAWSGAQWLAPTWGGRPRVQFPLPRTVIQVVGPGRIAAFAGEHFLASLERGSIVTLTTDVFSSAWMPELFATVRAELVAEHEGRRDARTASLDESLIRFISQQMVRRALWLIRAAHHGGMIIFVEPSDVETLLAGPLRAKYRFSEGEAPKRYRTLVRKITDELARKHRGVVTVDDFLDPSAELTALEARIFEISRLIASLASVDGAVLMTKRFELVAFGVEVLGSSSSPTRVRRALDAEAVHCVADREENVGTRHRAAYRFIQAHPRGMAVVVSQDGSVRFVARIQGEVTYFEQYITG